MTKRASRRQFVQTISMAGAGLMLSKPLRADDRKSVMVFTKSSGWEHDVVKHTEGQESIVERAVGTIGSKYGFTAKRTKDGRIFDSKDLHSFAAVFFFTTGDLMTLGTDGKPPMTATGKQALLKAVKDGMGFVGVHSASDTFHTQPDPEDHSNRYVAHGEQIDPYLKMLGGEFIIHGDNPRLQTANLIVNDAKFPGLEGVDSPVSFNEEWYSLKDFSPDLHVLLTLDTKGMQGECYQRAPYPVTWARPYGKGRVFYSAIGDRPENWWNPFFLDLLAGGLRWAIRDVHASIEPNLAQAAPGYAEMPPKPQLQK
jgi:uncharacterized protein